MINVFPFDLLEEFTNAATSPGPELARPALLIARLAYPKLDPLSYLRRLEELGSIATKRLADTTTPGAPDSAMYTISQFLFEDQGFTGNADDYDDPRNSFLNQVIDRRTGIPITLAVVYIEIARRAGIQVEGVNFPGHFLLRFPFGPKSDYNAAVFVDPFHAGSVLSETDCRSLLRRHTGDTVEFSPNLLAPATKQQILARMLRNLKRLYIRQRSFSEGRAITDLLLALDPFALDELRDRGLLSCHLDDYAVAAVDLERYLAFSSHADEGEERSKEREEIWNHLKAMRRRMATLN